MKDIGWIDNLTLKASYGVQGNDNIGTHFAVAAAVGMERAPVQTGEIAAVVSQQYGEFAARVEVEDTTLKYTHSRAPLVNAYRRLAEQNSFVQYDFVVRSGVAHTFPAKTVPLVEFCPSRHGNHKLRMAARHPHLENPPLDLQVSSKTSVAVGVALRHLLLGSVVACGGERTPKYCRSQTIAPDLPVQKVVTVEEGSCIL